MDEAERHRFQHRGGFSDLKRRKTKREEGQDRLSDLFVSIRMAYGNLYLKSEESPLCREPMDDDYWHEIVHTLGEKLASVNREMIQSLASGIREGILQMDAVMSAYCESTCPVCKDPCCEGRKVFYNRTDLLYLIALGEEIPEGQTRQKPLEPCRYLDPNGCRLPRIYRPYICVWFLCDPQIELFSLESPSFQRRFIAVLEEVRICRLYLESLYEHFSLSGFRISESKTDLTGL